MLEKKIAKPKQYISCKYLTRPVNLKKQKKQYITLVCMFVCLFECMYASMSPELLCPCVKGSKGQFVKEDTEKCDTWGNNGHCTHFLQTVKYTHYTVEYTHHTVEYTHHTVEYTHYTEQFTLYTVGYTLYSIVCPGGIVLCINNFG